ncbi:hypothetical protein Taro_034790 [Colocasia esculenta]|uniref:Uncharacterized protein n=1 Tax=Colocasia esculenta TaxID=4460 RepID=A0A843WCY3_COLES|nr:hypothetical protein [Colocasia esculenta]
MLVESSALLWSEGARRHPTAIHNHHHHHRNILLSSLTTNTVVPALHAMGVAYPHPPPSTAGFGQVIGEHASSDGDGDDLGTHLADD